MSAPQFPPAVLAALARWDTARRVCEAAREYSPAAGSYTLDDKLYHAMDDAFTALVDALDAFRAQQTQEAQLCCCGHPVTSHSERGARPCCRVDCECMVYMLSSQLIGDPSRDAAMHAAEDEALRDASPFRFTAKPRTEPML